MLWLEGKSFVYQLVYIVFRLKDGSQTNLGFYLWYHLCLIYQVSINASSFYFSSENPFNIASTSSVMLKMWISGCLISSKIPLRTLTFILSWSQVLFPFSSKNSALDSLTIISISWDVDEVVALYDEKCFFDWFLFCWIRDATSGPIFT